MRRQGGGAYRSYRGADRFVAIYEHLNGDQPRARLPAFLLAYTRGGTWFHLPALLSGLLLPLALIPAAALSRTRSAPALVVVTTMRGAATRRPPTIGPTATEYSPAIGFAGRPSWSRPPKKCLIS